MKKNRCIRSSINEILKFNNPLNKILEVWKRPNGLKIKRVTTSIGCNRDNL